MQKESISKVMGVASEGLFSSDSEYSKIAE